MDHPRTQAVPRPGTRRVVASHRGESTMTEPCRVTVAVDCDDTTYGRTARRTVHRHVEPLTSVEDGRLLRGRIRLNGRYQLVYRLSGDSLWTSIREEATGPAYERLAQV